MFFIRLINIQNKWHFFIILIILKIKRMTTVPEHKNEHSA